MAATWVPISDLEGLHWGKAVDKVLRSVVEGFSRGTKAFIPVTLDTDHTWVLEVVVMVGVVDQAVGRRRMTLGLLRSGAVAMSG
jgi:hypothetical protein